MGICRLRKFCGGIEWNGSYTITPTTTDISIPANTLLKEQLTISGDADLVAANILKDKNIFGVAGSAVVDVQCNHTILTKRTTSFVGTYTITVPSTEHPKYIVLYGLAAYYTNYDSNPGTAFMIYQLTNNTYDVLLATAAHFQLYSNNVRYSGTTTNCDQFVDCVLNSDGSVTFTYNTASTTNSAKFESLLPAGYSPSSVWQIYCTWFN